MFCPEYLAEHPSQDTQDHVGTALSFDKIMSRTSFGYIGQIARSVPCRKGFVKFLLIYNSLLRLASGLYLKLLFASPLLAAHHRFRSLVHPYQFRPFMLQFWQDPY
jgi:hypothetical protein